MLRLIVIFPALGKRTSALWKQAKRLKLELQRSKALKIQMIAKLGAAVAVAVEEVLIVVGVTAAEEAAADGEVVV